MDDANQLSPAEYEQSWATIVRLLSSPEGRATIERVQKLIARSEFKRRQAPPTLRVRGRAFGSGRQVPVTAVQF